MIYLIYGEDEYLVNEELKKVIDKNKDSFLIKYDDSYSKEINIFKVIDDCSNISLLQEKTLVLYKNPSFLINKLKDEDMNDAIYEKITKYFDKPNEMCDLVFYSSYKSFNSKLKLFKDVKDNSEVHYISALDQRRFNEICDNELEVSKIEIDKDAKELFIDNCGLDLSIFYSGLTNLKQYNGLITVDAINELTYSSDDFNKFSIVNALIEGKLTKSVKLIRKIKNDDFSVFELIALIASQLRYLYSVSYYETKCSSNKELMELTSTNSPYRLEMAKKTLKKISRINIMKLLYKLSSFDYKLKTEYSLEQSDLVELFITTFNS